MQAKVEAVLNVRVCVCGVYCCHWWWWWVTSEQAIGWSRYVQGKNGVRATPETEAGIAADGVEMWGNGPKVKTKASLKRGKRTVDGTGKRERGKDMSSNDTGKQSTRAGSVRSNAIAATVENGSRVWSWWRWLFQFAVCSLLQPGLPIYSAHCQPNGSASTREAANQWVWKADLMEACGWDQKVGEPQELLLLFSSLLSSVAAQSSPRSTTR